MMKVCHVTSVHKSTDGRIFERECTSLAKYYDVTLLAPNTNDYERNGVHILGVTLPQNRIKRILYRDTLLDKMISVKADIYHFHDPELISVGLKLKKRGKTIIFDSHEDVPSVILNKADIPFTRAISKFYALYERFALKRFDALVSVTPDIVNRLKLINPKTYLITNFPICEGIPDKRQWKRKIGFAGMVNSGWKIHIILEAIKDLDVVFELAGPISKMYRSQLESLDGWKKVNYRGVISHQEVFDMLQDCSIGMAISTDDNPNIGKKKGSIGVTKLFEYMGLGLPVIATDLQTWEPIIEGERCGFCVDCNDVESIKNYISYFLDNPQIAKDFGDKGRQIAKASYSWESQESSLFELYSSLTHKQKC